MNSQVNAFQRNFVNEVKRSDEMLRKLTNFANEIDLANTELAATKSPPILVQRGDEPLVELQLDELEVFKVIEFICGSLWTLFNHLTGFFGHPTRQLFLLSSA